MHFTSTLSLLFLAVSVHSEDTTTTVATTTEDIEATTTQYAFNCEERDDGNYGHPMEKCSRFFFTCAGGVAFQEACPYQTFYEVDTNRCQFKMYVPACGGVPEPTTTTNQPPMTSSQPPNDVPNIMFDCMGEIGNFPNPMNVCSHVFFICAPGYQYGIPFKCAANTFYDYTLNKCLYRSMVPACNGTQPIHVPSYSNATFNCTDKQGNYAPENVTCPEYFYQCASHRLSVTKIHCPTGAAYDVFKDACLSPTEVAGCENSTVTAATQPSFIEEGNATETMNATVVPPADMNATASNVTETPVVTEAPNATEALNVTEVVNATAAVNVTEALNTTEVIPADVPMNNNSSSNSSTVVEEVTAFPDSSNSTLDNSTAVENTTSAANETVGNATTVQPVVVDTAATDLPASGNATGEAMNTTETTLASNTTEELTTVGTTLNPLLKFGACKNRINGFYANPSDCESYFFCAQEAEYQIQCQGGTVFNERKNQCDSPTKVFKPCGQMEPPKNEFTCTDKNEGRHADVNDCNHYFSCGVDGAMTKHQCEGGLSFNMVTMQCDLPHNVPGCTPRPNTDLADFCASKGKDDIYAIGNPNNYVLCVHNVAFVGICPRIRPIFDIRTKSCVQA